MGYYQHPLARTVNYTPRGPYVGDPGFLSVLGKLGKGLLGVGSAVLPGGSVVGRAVGAISKVSAVARPAAGRVLSVVKAHPVLSAAGAAATVGAVGAGGMHAGAPTPAGGMKLGGGLRGHLGTGMRRHKRMRVTNVKALHRAVRRCHGFERLARKVLRITSPKKRHTFSGFRRKKKAR